MREIQASFTSAGHEAARQLQQQAPNPARQGKARRSSYEGIFDRRIKLNKRGKERGPDR